MDILKAYAQDQDAVDNGKWMTTREGVRVKVAKHGNAKYVAEVKRLQKPHLALIRSGKDSSELIDKITTEAMAKTLLLDWEATSNGEPVEYTWELGNQYMTLSEDFKDDISVLSIDRNNFKPEDTAEK